MGTILLNKFAIPNCVSLEIQNIPFFQTAAPATMIFWLLQLIVFYLLIGRIVLKTFWEVEILALNVFAKSLVISAKFLDKIGLVRKMIRTSFLIE